MTTVQDAPDLQRPLTGHVALVTGAAVRVGRVIALALARRGAHVVLTYRESEEPARRTVAELEEAGREHGVRALALRCEVTDEQQIDAVFERIDREHGRLDLLVNNAAVFDETPFESLDLEAWQSQLDVNLTAPMLFAKRAGDRMLEQEDGGLIVNVACAGALKAWPRHLAYCVSKAGLWMLTQGLAKALGPKVRVNAVAPGPVLHPEGYEEERRQRSLRNTVLRRMGRPEDVARAVLFAWDSDYTTGALLPVEGGRLIV
jgi:NAD(P)-dependent dehydrogenase (short-subunit alcohol dehydrogenase family)